MWSLKLTDDQREAVRALITAKGSAAADALKGALEALDYARWDDLPEAQLPWERVAELASAQGISEADVVWDLAGGLSARPVRKPGPRRRSAQAAARTRR